MKKSVSKRPQESPGVEFLEMHLFALAKNAEPDYPHCEICGGIPGDPIHTAAAWREEALQLRKNNAELNRQMKDFAELFDGILPDSKIGKATPGLPLCCLALHHLAMSLAASAGKNAQKIMMASNVDDLPNSFGRFGKADTADATGRNEEATERKALP
jgi:hypothetical protein